MTVAIKQTRTIQGPGFFVMNPKVQTVLNSEHRLFAGFTILLNVKKTRKNAFSA